MTYVLVRRLLSIMRSIHDAIYRHLHSGTAPFRVDIKGGEIGGIGSAAVRLRKRAEIT